MDEVFATIRLTPHSPSKIAGDYDVDRVALEANAAGEITDFRLECGRGYEIDWLIPIEPNGYLRLIRTGYVTVDMDPVVLEAPCPVEFSDEWEGELGKIGEHTLVHTRVEMTLSGYLVECRVRHADGVVRSYRLSYQQA